MVVAIRWAGLSVLETAELLGILHTTISEVYTEWCKITNTEKTLSERSYVLFVKEVKRKITRLV